MRERALHPQEGEGEVSNHRSDCLCQDCLDDHTERLREMAEGPAAKEPEQSPSRAKDATTYIQYCITNRIPIPAGDYRIDNPVTFPSLPPGSPSGVVEALRPDGRVYYYRTGFGHTMIQLEDGYYNGAKPYKSEAYYLESNPGLRSLPQSPATPAAAPVGECPQCQLVPWGHCSKHPAPGSQGVEAPRKEAREAQLFTREVCPECKNSDVADCLGALPCPHCSGGYIYTEVREGDNHG